MDGSIEKLTPMAHMAQNRCFGCGQANPAGLRLEFMLAENGSVVCLTTISASFEGPSGFLHGGIIATLLDESMSKSLRAKGLTTMTRQMEVEYLRPIHSGAPIRLEGRLVRSEGRKHWSEARILSPRGHILAEGKGLFVEVRSGQRA
ncbi:MAG: PaaI family thioesterase [Terracidiphilus sp.]